MIKINQIKVSAKKAIDEHDSILKRYISNKLKIKENDICDFKILKRSIDARKGEVNYVYSVCFTTYAKVDFNRKDIDISPYEETKYVFPKTTCSPSGSDRPIIIGLGPAGLFCAYMLVKNGYKPIILERGKCIEERTKDVEKFWQTGILDTSSNVQFGEGGAGTFSDGKLNTLVKDKNGRNTEVLKILVEFGAPGNILYDNKPHIGTDLLKDVVGNISKYIVDNGGEIHYETCVDTFVVDDNNRIIAVACGNQEYKANKVVLAVGHSARDTFEVLKSMEVNMHAKAFAVGFRVMHPQNIIDANQYCENYEEYDLPVSSYKVTSNFDRGVYSFCMCPGGYVVNASSENGRLAVNGMSYHDRDSGIANSAIIIQVTPDDYGSDDVLSGMYWQRSLEEKAYKLANGRVPVQKYGDFRKKYLPDAICENALEFSPAIKGEYEYKDLTNILTNDLNMNFINGMEFFGRKIKHFSDGNVILAGIESRTSSPVRIVRDDNGESSIKGLYPCGEGAGYAGGITSAAMDGIYIAERIALNA